MNIRNGVFAFVLLATTTPGCFYFRSPVIPPVGIGLTNYSVPVDTTFRDTHATGREGRSASRCIFGLFAWGDASVTAAAQKGGLAVVDQVDCKVTIILLGLYSEYETIVTGS